MPKVFLKKLGGLAWPDIKTYYKHIIIKTDWYWHKDRHLGQWSRTESVETDPYIYAQLIFDKGEKTVQWRKDSVFNK